MDGKRRQLQMAITWRGSITLRGNLSTTKGRARRVDLQCPGDVFRARCPPGCLPPAPKLRTFDRGRPAGGGDLAARGSAPGPRASRGTLAIKTGGWQGIVGAYCGVSCRCTPGMFGGIPKGNDCHFQSHRPGECIPRRGEQNATQQTKTYEIASVTAH